MQIQPRVRSVALLKNFVPATASSLQLYMLALSLWPVWIWYCQRLQDRSDEPLGIVALVTFCLLRYLGPHLSPGPGANTLASLLPPPAATVLLLLYGFSVFFAPKLFLAFLAVLAIGICLNGRGQNRLSAGEWALLVLSLPVISALNFYAGYPLRLLVCQAAVPLLNINGFAAIAQGTGLIYNGQSIEVDAPCSGIRMLWASLYLAATLAGLRRLEVARGLSLMILAVVLAVAANVLRVTSLFYLESGTISLPPRFDQAVHEGIGVSGFLLLAIALLTLANYFSRTQNESSPTGKKSSADSGADSDSSAAATAGAVERLLPAALKTPAYIGFLACCIACAVLPFGLWQQRPEPSKSMPVPASGWFSPGPGEVLCELPLSARQGQIAAAFPGEIKIFTCGHKTVVYRCMRQATRQLHPAADCYRAGGYEIKYLPRRTDSDGTVWGLTEAVRGAEKLQIKERIFDDHGHSWTDVSSWYWSALTGGTKGPWWSVMIVGAAAAG